MKTRLALLCLALAGCPKSSGDWVPDDIDEEETLDRLGEAGYQRVCRAFDDFVRDRYRSSYLIRAVCTAHALQTSGNAVECGQVVESCLDTLPAPVEAQLAQILAQADCSVVEAMVTGCSSPVSKLTGCLDELGTELDEIQFSLTCAAFGSPVPPDWWKVSLPPACVALGESC